MVAIESIMRDVGATTFSNIGDLKKQSSLKGFPQPMRAQMESSMPLTQKGSKIMAAMKKQYGEKKGEGVFYASRNKGTIKGVDPESSKPKKRRHKVRFPSPSKGK